MLCYVSVDFFTPEALHGKLDHLFYPDIADGLHTQIS